MAKRDLMLEALNNIFDKKSDTDYDSILSNFLSTPENDLIIKDVVSLYSKLIKEKRIEKNLTQEDLAKQIGKNRAYIARIEQGNTDIQLSNFIQIINALGLSFQIV